MWISVRSDCCVKSSLRICTISFPVIKAFSTPLLNLERTLLGSKFHVTEIIGYEEFPVLPETAGVHRHLIRYWRWTRSQVLHQISFLLLQIRIGVKMLLISRETDLFFFFMQTGPIIPLLIARLLGKKTIWMLPSSMERMAQYQQYALPGAILWIQDRCYRMADALLLYAPDLIDVWGLGAYRQKILIAHEHIIDTDRFRDEVPVHQREPVIGFVGRFSEEKGILPLVRAISGVHQEMDDLRFLLIGDGPCTGMVREYIVAEHLEDVVTLPGWVETAQLPQYLNQMTLLVLPSLTEGLPNVMLEAMACGTPVLASNVGAIPAVILDGQNGYLLKDISDGCIANSILSVLNDPARAEVAASARRTIAASFSPEMSAAGMKEVINRVCTSKK